MKLVFRGHWFSLGLVRQSDVYVGVLLVLKLRMRSLIVARKVWKSVW